MSPMLTQTDDVGKRTLRWADLPTAAPQNHTVPPTASPAGAHTTTNLTDDPAEAPDSHHATWLAVTGWLAGRSQFCCRRPPDRPTLISV